MTNITFSKQGDTVWFRCEGHAGFAKAGEDIVCAGISTLAQSFAAFISALDAEKEIMLKRFIIEDGLIDIIFDDFKKNTESAQTMTLLGFRMLEDQFPDYLHLEWGEIKKKIG